MLRFIDYPHWTSGVSEMSREALIALAEGVEWFREWVAKHPDIAIMLPGQRPKDRAKALESMPMAVHDETIVYVPSAERQAEVADQLAAILSNPVRFEVIKQRTPIKTDAQTRVAWRDGDCAPRFSISGRYTPTDKDP